MTDHADLIAEAREYLSRDLTEKSVDFIRRVLAALEAQPAPLVADSREALSRALFDIDNAGGTLYTYALAGKLLASGVVSLAADRDRATAERAWDEGFAIGLNFDSDNYGFTNPYREGEARND